MYEDKVLDLVSRTIPVYHRQKKGEIDTVRPEGHFACEGCDRGPMSVGRRYTTAVAVDFDGDGQSWQFLFSRDDMPYAEMRNHLYGELRMSVHNGWTYIDGETWNEQELYIRGYWDEETFIHKTGIVRMRDVLPMVMARDDDGDDWWPEMAIQTIRPPANGAYFDIPHANLIGKMGKEEARKYMVIHRSSTLAKARREAGWTLHGGMEHGMADVGPRKRAMNLDQRIEEAAIRFRAPIDEPPFERDQI